MVIVITLLALILIASLVFYVFNLGRSVQNRVVTQNAADAAASAGATWIARTFNGVAMNNVQISRLLAMDVVLDAVDQALPPAYAEAVAMRDALTAQMPAANGDFTAAEANFLNQRMQPWLTDYTRNAVTLEALKRLFIAPSEPAEFATPSGNFDVRRVTFFNGPNGKGQIWKAIAALDALSQAMIGNMPALAQLAAKRSAEANMGDGGAGATGLMLPILPKVAWKRTTFADFKRPVKDGLLPEGVDDKLTNRGPFDVLFGWREPVRKTRTIDPGIPGTKASGPSGPGGVGPANGRGTNPKRETTTVGYRVYGPMEWMLDRNDVLPLPARSYQMPFHRWCRTFARMKLGYLFDHAAVKNYDVPLWKVGSDQIFQIADSGVDDLGNAAEIAGTRYLVVRIESDVPRESGAFLTGGTYTMPEPPRLVEMKGDWIVPNDPCKVFGNDPRQWQNKLILWRDKCKAYKSMSPGIRSQWDSAGFFRVGDGAWRFQSMMLRTDPVTGDMALRWQYAYYFLLGVNVQARIEIRNPAEGIDDSQLPAPIEFDHSVPSAATGVQWSDAGQWNQFPVLGVARRLDRPTFWPSAFNGDRHRPQMAAVAQAYVFNDHSWDLWTQMWHAQLQKVDHYDEWIAMLDETRSNAADIPGVNMQTIDEIDRYLRDTQPLAPVMLNH